MEPSKNVGSSSSSFTNDLFGSKDSSSSGIFGSIFSPSPKVLGRESLRSEEKKKDSENDDAWNTKSAASDDISKSSQGEGHSAHKPDMSYIYQEQQQVQPCHLSSSIYYGGPDVYNFPQSTKSSEYTYDKDKDGGEDSGAASRGNWWQGSLYY